MISAIKHLYRSIIANKLRLSVSDSTTIIRLKCYKSRACHNNRMAGIKHLQNQIVMVKLQKHAQHSYPCHHPIKYLFCRKHKVCHAYAQITAY